MELADSEKGIGGGDACAEGLGGVGEGGGKGVEEEGEEVGGEGGGASHFV